MNPTDDEMDPYRRMGELVTAYWIPQVIRAAVDLSLAEHLADGGKDAAEIAERENSALDTTFRLMRACVAVGLLRAEADGRFFSTRLLDTLHRDAPGSLRGLALATTLPAQWLSWNEFTASVRQGSSQADEVLGGSFFDYLEKHPDQARDFSDGLSSTTPLWTSAASEVIDTSTVSLAVDVGGANGSLLHLLNKTNPSLRGIVFDRPNCRAAMKPGGRIAVIEMLIGEIDNPGPAALIDMAMLAIVPGKERSLDEYDALFAQSGLRRSAVRATTSGQSVIEAVAG